MDWCRQALVIGDVRGAQSEREPMSSSADDDQISVWLFQLDLLRVLSVIFTEFVRRDPLFYIRSRDNPMHAQDLNF